jgi:hypothetical protein
MEFAAAAGPLEYEFFSIPRLGALNGSVDKDYRHTNMVQANRLEEGQEFTIRGLSAYFRLDAAANPTVADAEIVNSGWYQIKIGNQHTVLTEPLCRVPNGGADLVYFWDNSAAAQLAIARGVSAASNVRPLTEAIRIENRERFSVTVTLPGTIAAVTQLTFVLHGDFVQTAH